MNKFLTLSLLTGTILINGSLGANSAPVDTDYLGLDKDQYYKNTAILAEEKYDTDVEYTYNEDGELLYIREYALEADEDVVMDKDVEYDYEYEDEYEYEYEEEMEEEDMNDDMDNDMNDDVIKGGF
jgi:Na+-transporting NADH:ubiquinone oxidoreductase subunit NqrA